MSKVTFRLIIINIFLSTAFANFEKELQTQLILAEPGDTITLDEGRFEILGTLSMEGKENIVIRGAGMDQTILSFSNQIEGAQGLSITNCKRIILENFTIQNTIGDGIKVQYTDGIVFRNVKAEWTGGPKETNGAYGLYPVQCSNVLIEYSMSIGASDAGLYVGQSKNIIVRSSEVYHNVAGIEIENSINADVYNNYAHDNTGGILIFDLPDLIQKSGKNVRIFNNLIENNNLDNFAPEGNIVGQVPPGTGIMVMAVEKVEIFKNTIRNNKTAGTTIVSYFITEEAIKDSLYNPYTASIYIHDNIYERESQLPTLNHDIGVLLALRFRCHVPDIIYDGMPDPRYANADGQIPADRRLCLENNLNAGYVNLDISKNFNKWYSPFIASFSTDKDECNCSQTPISAVKLNIIE